MKKSILLLLAICLVFVNTVNSQGGLLKKVTNSMTDELQQMQQKMVQGGGPGTMLPKLVTNIPDATYDPTQSVGGVLNGNIKYDDILFVAYDKIKDLQGKTLLTIKPWINYF